MQDEDKTQILSDQKTVLLRPMPSKKNNRFPPLGKKPKRSPLLPFGLGVVLFIIGVFFFVYLPKKAPKKAEPVLSGPALEMSQAKNISIHKALVSEKTTPWPSYPSLKEIQQLNPLPTGTSVGIGPIFFSSLDLEKCEKKCVLPMKDQNGGSLQVIFFKDAYSVQLTVLDERDGVWVFGQMQNDGVTFLLSDLKPY
jgi:hypothetical protein